MAITISTPTIGGNEDTWGSVLNTQLTAIESTFNGSGTGKATVAPDLSTLTINGTNVTATAAEINYLDGVTSNIQTQLDGVTSGLMTSFQLEDGDGTEVTISDGKEIKFVEGIGIDINWTDTSTGSDADPYDLTFSLKADGRQTSNIDAYTGNSNDYIFYDESVGMRFYTATVEEMRLDNNGNLHVDQNITAYSTTTASDQRLKHDIKKIDGALDKVGQLNGYTFSLNKDNKKSAGVIAQEVEKVLPSAVSDQELAFQGDEGQKYKTVEYDQLHGLLIEAIKELKAEIEELKNGSTD